MRIHLTTLGCRLNEAELEHWSRQFEDRGHRLAREAAEADLMVVNTCAVTAEAARKSRKLIRRLHRQNQDAKLVVSGCYTALNRGEAAAALGADLVISNRDKDRLVEIAHRELDLNAMPALARRPGENALFARDRQRGFVKVQDGCRYRCTFCVVTLARGEERSRAQHEIVAEVNQLHTQGIQEVVLTGVHIGGYGSDIGTDLYSLVQTLLDKTAIPRLRLGSVEPWDLPPRFWSLFENPRFMPHLHLPLQSGSDSVLRRMARRCRRADFKHLVEQAHAQVPDLNITTDIIVGFPGETDAEWQQTLEFVEAIGFGHLHIFTYSPRAGTKAAGLPDQIDSATKRKRSAQLHALGERLKTDHLRRYLGREFPVLVEGTGIITAAGYRRWNGYTPNFLRVNLSVDLADDLTNRIHKVRLEGLTETGAAVSGRLVGK